MLFLLPENIITIQDFAFQKTGVKFSSLPDSLQEIGMSSFANCSDIDIIDLNNVKIIGARCF